MVCARVGELAADRRIVGPFARSWPSVTPVVSQMFDGVGPEVGQGESQIAMLSSSRTLEVIGFDLQSPSELTLIANYLDSDYFVLLPITSGQTSQRPVKLTARPNNGILARPKGTRPDRLPCSQNGEKMIELDPYFDCDGHLLLDALALSAAFTTPFQLADIRAFEEKKKGIRN